MIRIGWRHRLALPSRIVHMGKINDDKLFAYCADGSRWWIVGVWGRFSLAVRRGVC